MKMIGKEYGQPIEILKFNDFKGAPCMVSAEGIAADGNGKKIVNFITNNAITFSFYKPNPLFWM